VRTGAALIELNGHTNWFTSASFNPDGTRIVTLSSAQTATVWDAWTGTAVLDLKGYTGLGTSASFAPDGSRIVIISGGGTAQVWDARSGRELKGEPIPQIPPPGVISPDGRWCARPIGNQVELIPTQPDEEDLAYRRFLMQPNFRLYRECYDAATKANDAFAARFYLNLCPPPERALIRAEPMVGSLFARLLLRDDVIAALEAQPAADPEIHAACLKMAGDRPESAADYNNVAWPLIRDPGQPGADYQRGLRLSKAACRLEPDNGTYLNTLGVAQYRTGMIAEALATLTRSSELNKQSEAADLAILALAQHRLGQSDKARATLARLREVMQDPQRAGNPEAQAFLREAETIELDQVFPADPFAR
jgi:WD40 repeat protein